MASNDVNDNIVTELALDMYIFRTSGYLGDHVQLVVFQLVSEFRGIFEVGLILEVPLH